MTRLCHGKLNQRWAMYLLLWCWLNQFCLLASFVGVWSARRLFCYGCSALSVCLCFVEIMTHYFMKWNVNPWREWRGELGFVSALKMWIATNRVTGYWFFYQIIWYHKTYRSYTESVHFADRSKVDCYPDLSTPVSQPLSLSRPFHSSESVPFITAFLWHRSKVHRLLSRPFRSCESAPLICGQVLCFFWLHFALYDTGKVCDEYCKV